jgi:hypothetical protein
VVWRIQYDRQWYLQWPYAINIGIAYVVHRRLCYIEWSVVVHRAPMVIMTCCCVVVAAVTMSRVIVTVVICVAIMCMIVRVTMAMAVIVLMVMLCMCYAYTCYESEKDYGN